jgi:hypothetical protein
MSSRPLGYRGAGGDDGGFSRGAPPPPPRSDAGYRDSARDSMQPRYDVRDRERLEEARRCAKEPCLT